MTLLRRCKFQGVWDFLTGLRFAFPGLLAPGAPDVVADVDAVRLTGWVTAWSYLIEKNRVWNPSFLAKSGDRSIPDARR